jgi:hypothetical protein
MANWIGHILRRNCLLKQIIERKIKGEMEVTRRRGKSCRKLLDSTVWRARFGRSFGPVVRQSAEWMNVLSGKKTYAPTFDFQQFFCDLRPRFVRSYAC